MRRRRWFLNGFALNQQERDVRLLRMRASIELPPGQAAIAQALLIDAPEFEPPERPVTFDVIALALGIQVTTVREHLRRIRQRHSELYADLMEERRKRLERWHADVARRRLDRSRRWGKQRWACRYRRMHGEWPWGSLTRRQRR